MSQSTTDLLLKYLYDATPEELSVIQNRLSGQPEEKVSQFCAIYRSKRKDPQTILICCLLGFVGIAGVHRFLMDQIGMGILYFLTGGLCAIGTIVDLINYKNLALEYNGQKIAETMAMMNIVK